MRRGCFEQQENKFWDEWLANAEIKLPKIVLSKMIEEGLGHIKFYRQELEIK